MCFSRKCSVVCLASRAPVQRNFSCCTPTTSLIYCVCSGAGEKGFFKGNAKGRVESPGPVSTASYIPLPWDILYDNHLALHSTYRWYVGSGVGRLWEKGSTGTRSLTEWCAPAAVTRGAARFYTRTCIIAVVKPFSLLMELWDYQKPRKLKSFQYRVRQLFIIIIMLANLYNFCGEFVAWIHFRWISWCRRERRANGERHFAI
jgi:hypothetical protein